MNDNLTENTDEKDIKHEETKTLEQRILDDINAYEAGEVKNLNNIAPKVVTEDIKEEKTKTSEVSEPVNTEEQNQEELKTEEKKEQVKPAVPAAASGESNYQINLINENLLRIRVKTKKGVNIDCSVKDTKSLTETQSNRLYLHPKQGEEIQEVEIIISIDPSTGELIVEKKKDENGQLVQPVSFTPNPDVENLIMPVDLGRPDEPLIPLTEDELLEQKIGKKNPFHLNRLLYRKNMTIGIISAVVFACICSLLFYNFYGKTETKTIEQEKRLIVINDIPVKINFKEYEDPNKPKEEPKEDGTPTDKVQPPVIKKNIIRAPKITRPKINIPQDSNLTNDATRQLDSLRKLQANNDSLKKVDSLKNVTGNYSIPDSLKKGFSEGELGLRMSYPQNWKVIDMRNIDKSVEKFKGVILTDTTAKENGTANIFISLDNEGKDYNAAEFKNTFQMNDSALTAYENEPKTVAGSTNLRFFIFLKTDKLSVNAQIKKQYFDQYRPIVEAIVRSLNIIPPAPPK
ncbi:MAG: hypothetical protein JST55_09140 [Bacteroidetes bacterium]|nr:hypothetical protein [Bacteroidota bacterium]